MPESNPLAPKSPSDPNEGSTPEDVATLYSWANLHGAKYRDFSASRAQAREEARLRVEEAQAEERRRQEEEAERKAQEEAQIAARLAAEAAEAARQAEAERLAEIARQAEAERQAVLAAQEAQRQAALQRSWQPDAPEAIQSSFTPQFAADAPPPVVTPPTVDIRPQSSAERGSAPLPAAPVASQNPFQAPAYTGAPAAYPEFHAGPFGMPSYPEETYPASHEPFSPSPWHALEMRETREMSSQPAWLAPEIPVAPVAPVAAPAPQQNRPPVSQAMPPAQTPIPMYEQPVSFGVIQQQVPARGLGNTGGQPNPQTNPQPHPQYSPQVPSGFPGNAAAIVEDTLAGSRERITNRWYALKSLFDPQTAPVEQVQSQAPARVPVLAVFSLAGGVGKTSLVASLGRALSSRGERVLLVDTAAYGLLPFFFGARDQRPGMLRTFNPPGMGADAPIQMVTLDPDGQASEYGVGDESNRSGHGQGERSNEAQSNHGDWLSQEVTRYSRGTSRVLIDLPTASGSTTRRVLRLSPIVLVPVLPDMNSVVSVGAIESFFRNQAQNQGMQVGNNSKPNLPYYILNQFDYSLPLHLDVREILREQIGDRLLPFALRRSPSVSEALAEGMTVMDYAPTAVVAEDYANLAGWVRSFAPASQSPQKFGRVRWSEQ